MFFNNYVSHKLSFAQINKIIYFASMIEMTTDFYLQFIHVIDFSMNM